MSTEQLINQLGKGFSAEDIAKIAEIAAQVVEETNRQNPAEPIVREAPAFRVISGDFVTTEDGTGIVHIAPTFGADDDRAAKQSRIAPMLLTDKNGKQVPMVDLTGKFYKIEDLDPAFVAKNVDTELYEKFAGKFVKDDYLPAAKPASTAAAEIAAETIVRETLAENRETLSGFSAEQLHKINTLLKEMAEKEI